MRRASIKWSNWEPIGSKTLWAKSMQHVCKLAMKGRHQGTSINHFTIVLWPFWRPLNYLGSCKYPTGPIFFCAHEQQPFKVFSF